jgi:hypothetical protein
MTLARLRQKRGAEEQLYPLLERVGARVWDYKRNNEETTQRLIDAGLVVRPKPSRTYKGAMENTLESFFSLGPEQHLIIDEASGIFPPDKTSKIPTHLIERYPTGGANKTLYMRVANLDMALPFPTRKLGYDWQRTSDGTICISYLLYSMLAKIMLDDIGPSLKVRDYISDKDPSKNYREGGNVIVEEVPSVSTPGKTYKIQLMSIPVFSKQELAGYGVPTEISHDMNDYITKQGFPPELAKQTFNISAKDPCESDITLNMSYGRPFQSSERRRVRKTPEELMDHHVILAYWALQESLKENKPEFMAANVFCKPKADEEVFFWKAYERALLETKDELTGSISRKPLDFVALETLLDNYKAY